MPMYFPIAPSPVDLAYTASDRMRRVKSGEAPQNVVAVNPDPRSVFGARNPVRSSNLNTPSCSQRSVILEDTFSFVRETARYNYGRRNHA